MEKMTLTSVVLLLVLGSILGLRLIGLVHALLLILVCIGRFGHFNSFVKLIFHDSHVIFELIS